MSTNSPCDPSCQVQRSTIVFVWVIFHKWTKHFSLCTVMSTITMTPALHHLLHHLYRAQQHLNTMWNLIPAEIRAYYSTRFTWSWPQSCPGQLYFCAFTTAWPYTTTTTHYTSAIYITYTNRTMPSSCFLWPTWNVGELSHHPRGHPLIWDPSYTHGCQTQSINFHSGWRRTTPFCLQNITWHPWTTGWRRSTRSRGTRCFDAWLETSRWPTPGPDQARQTQQTQLGRSGKTPWSGSWWLQGTLGQIKTTQPWCLASWVPTWSSPRRAGPSRTWSIIYIHFSSNRPTSEEVSPWVNVSQFALHLSFSDRINSQPTVLTCGKPFCRVSSRHQWVQVNCILIALCLASSC